MCASTYKRISCRDFDRELKRITEDLKTGFIERDGVRYPSTVSWIEVDCKPQSTEMQSKTTLLSDNDDDVDAEGEEEEE